MRNQFAISNVQVCPKCHQCERMRQLGSRKDTGRCNGRKFIYYNYALKVCLNCGVIYNRDYAAAENMLYKGRQIDISGKESLDLCFRQVLPR
jgi:transposase